MVGLTWAAFFQVNYVKHWTGCRVVVLSSVLCVPCTRKPHTHAHTRRQIVLLLRLNFAPNPMINRFVACVPIVCSPLFPDARYLIQLHSLIPGCVLEMSPLPVTTSVAIFILCQLYEKFNNMLMLLVQSVVCHNYIVYKKYRCFLLQSQTMFRNFIYKRNCSWNYGSLCRIQEIPACSLLYK